jgi:hypothetical protein
MLVFHFHVNFHCRLGEQYWKDDGILDEKLNELNIEVNGYTEIIAYASFSTL